MIKKLAVLGENLSSVPRIHIRRLGCQYPALGVDVLFRAAHNIFIFRDTYIQMTKRKILKNVLYLFI